MPFRDLGAKRNQPFFDQRFIISPVPHTSHFSPVASGSGDQRAVQQQLLALSTARTSLTHVLAERLIQRVNLHLALGGGFEPPVSAAAAQ